MSFCFRFPTAPLAGWLVVGLSLAVRAEPSTRPDLREFLVPQQHLGEVLKSSPKAVLLSAEQFATLWRDSRPAKMVEANLPPVPAVLRKAHYTGTPGERFVTLRGELSAECLTDDWTVVPLPLNPAWMGAVKVDGQTAVQVSGDSDNNKSASLNLVLRGKGTHALTVDFAVPVEDLSGRRSLTMNSPGAAEATLTLTVPDKVQLESAEPVVQQAGKAVIALPAEPRPFTVTWSRQDLAPLETAAVFQQFKTSYLIDPVRLEADLEISWQSPLRPLPPQWTLPLPPDVTVLGVEGPEVQQWTLAGDQLVVDLLPGKRQDASVRVVLERGLNLAEAAGPLKLALPAPVAGGVPRAAGQFSIFTTHDLRVRQVNAGPLAERDDSRTPMNRLANAVGTWVFPVLPQAPEVEVQALRVQFAATLDTQITLSREAVRLKRWLSLTPRDGTLFSPTLEGLAAGEEVESVTRPDGSEVVWRKTETGLVFPDNQGIAAGTTWPVVVSSRLDPAGWQAMSQAALNLNLASARVPGAGKVNGYVALDFEDALLVSTTAATGLETRDPRQFAGVVPLTGRMAWSRLEDYQLNLTVARRAPEYDAAVVLYALPLLNSLEVEGALTLNIDRSPLREARVVFPAEAAASVRWDSPLLAESVLEPDNVSWRLRFHQETDGAPVLRFRLSVPLTDATEAAPAGADARAAAPERRFKVAAPVPSVPGSRRLQGTVVVEANTDTELGFAADGLNALDTLRAPALEGYTPRHRLVSAWGWLGGEPSLTVSGVRHRPGDLVSTVVDKLILDTVVSQDGPVRHQARMDVRTAGDQYLDVVLPEQARILTLLVNEGAVKPVRNRQGGLRVPLSGNVAVVRLICECPGQPMKSASRQSLVPVSLDPALPVLDTRWRLHLPDGFTYDGFDTNLTAVKAGAPLTPGVVQLALAELNPLGMFSYGSKSEVAVEYLPGGSGDSLSPQAAAYEAAQKERAARMVNVLNQRLKSQEQEVEEARIEMMQLMKQHGIVDLSVITSRGLSPTIGTSDDSYRASKQSELQMRTEVATLKAQQEQLQGTTGDDLVGSVLQLGVKDLTIENFAAKYKTDQAEYQRLLSSGLGKSHPKVVGLNQQIEEYQKILLSAAEHYRDSLGITIRNLEDALRSVQEISSAKKEESVEEKQKAAEYAQTKTRYEMKLDLLNQMRETALKTQVNDLLPGGSSRGSESIFDTEKSAEARLFRETQLPEVETFKQEIAERNRKMQTEFETRTYDVPTDFLSKGSGPKGASADPFSTAGAEGSALTKRPDAKTILTQLGIEFPEGATATYSAATGKLIVRNTREQLENAAAVVLPMQSGQAAASDKEGILPLDFALPEGGTVYAFAGPYAPGAVAFHYQSWERRLQWSWLWMFTGAAAFLLLARRRPWLSGLAGLLILQFLPGILGRPDWLPIANALVIGWVTGGLLRVERWALRRKKTAKLPSVPAGQVAVIGLMLVGALTSESKAETGDKWSLKTQVTASGLIRHEVNARAGVAVEPLKVNIPTGAEIRWLAINQGFQKPERNADGKLVLSSTSLQNDYRFIADMKVAPLGQEGTLHLEPILPESSGMALAAEWEICLPAGLVCSGPRLSSIPGPDKSLRSRIAAAYGDLKLGGGFSGLPKEEVVPAGLTPAGVLSQLKELVALQEKVVQEKWEEMMTSIREGLVIEYGEYFERNLSGKLPDDRYRTVDARLKSIRTELDRMQISNWQINRAGGEEDFGQTIQRGPEDQFVKSVGKPHMRHAALLAESRAAGMDPNSAELKLLARQVEQERELLTPAVARCNDRWKAMCKVIEFSTASFRLEMPALPKAQIQLQMARYHEARRAFAQSQDLLQALSEKLLLGDWVRAAVGDLDEGDWAAMLEQRISVKMEDRQAAWLEMNKIAQEVLKRMPDVDLDSLDRLAFAFREVEFQSASAADKELAIRLMQGASIRLEPLSGYNLVAGADQYPFVRENHLAKGREFRELLIKFNGLTHAGAGQDVRQLDLLRDQIRTRLETLVAEADLCRQNLRLALAKAEELVRGSYPTTAELLEQADGMQLAAAYHESVVRYKIQQAALDELTALKELAGSSRGMDSVGWMVAKQELPVNGYYRWVEMNSGESMKGVEVTYGTEAKRSVMSWSLIALGAAMLQLLPRRRFCLLGLVGLLVIQFLPFFFGRPDWLPVANALVSGWVTGGLLRVVRWALRRKKDSGSRTAVPASVLVVLLMLVGALPQKVMAEEVAAKPAAEVPVVVVPYDPAHPDDKGDQRYLSYETFERLWAAAKENRVKAAEKSAGESEKGERGSTLTAAMHRAVVDGAVLRVEAVYQLQTRGPDWVRVPFGLSGGLRSLLLDGTPAALSEGQLLVEKAGNHTVAVAYDVPLPAGWQEVSWQVPQATAASLALSLAMADPARPVVNAGAPQVETEVEGRRIFTAVLGAVDRISLQRRTTAERAGAQAAVPPLAAVKTRVYVTPALERVESVMAFSFAGQAREAFSLRMEAGLIPVSFSVPGLENWALRREGEWQVLDLKLERPVRDLFEVSLVAERPVGVLPLSETAPQVSAGAGRVELEWSVLATDDLEVKPQPGEELRRVGFVRAEGSGDEGFDAVGTWQAGGTAAALRWELRPKVPEASAVVRYALQPGAGKLELSAGMELRPAPGRELRELTIRVPAGSTIQGVTGERLSDWWHEDTALHIRFSGGAAEVTALALNLTQPLAAGAAEVGFKPLGIEGFAKVSGSGLVIAPLNQDAVLRLAPAGPSLREVAPAETRSGFTIRRPFEEKRGFVFEGSDWTAVTRLAPLAERYDVDWVMEAEVRDSWVALNARVLVSLTRGGVERLVFTTPATAPEFRVTSEDVRETVSVVEGNVRRYTVSFQTLMTGAVLFTLTGQMPHNGMTGLPDVEFPGAARTARFVIVNNKSEGELKVDAAGVEVTPREQVSFLPEELANGQTGAQFYAARAGWSMKLGVEKLESTAGQAALVLHADLTTSLLLNGDVWQRAVYVVQNRALQFLPVQLPADAEVVSVSVGGETTRADQGTVDGVPVMLVPLIQTAAGELATEVKLIYRRRGQPGKFPDLLDDPALPGLAVGQTFWTVQYPDEWKVEVTGGNMTSTDPTGLDSEKAMSRLSELVSLRSIASSDKYDDETRAKAKRNAQSVVSLFQKSAKQVDDAEIIKALDEFKAGEEDVPQRKEPNAKPVAKNDGAEGVKTKQFSFNKTTKEQVDNLNNFKQEVQAGATALNDNVLWANGNLPSKGKPEAAPGNKDSNLNNGNRRLSQIDKMERGKKADTKPHAVELKDAAKPAERDTALYGSVIVDPRMTQTGTNSNQEFSDRNSDYSFRNVRLNTLTSVPDVSNNPASPPAPAAAAPNMRAADAPADPFASPEVPDGADGGKDADARRLRTSGRSSLEAVFPEQRNAVHFKKVKGDASLEIRMAQPLMGGVDKGRAVGLGFALLVLWFGSWVLGRIRL